MNKQFTVSSSNGELKVDVTTGDVVSCFMGEGGEGIDQIQRFDVAENEKYNGREIEEGDDLDILDFGYWCKDGTYEEPAHDWREETIKIRSQHK